MQRNPMALSVRSALAAMGIASLIGYNVQVHAQTSAPAASTAAPSGAGSSADGKGTNKTDNKKKSTSLTAITVTGQLAAIQRAQSIKQDAVNVVDSISAEEAGKFPDPNVADALQR
ncbi:MAG TPA: hypothetical protein VMA74_04430, partial [Dyella sp.]|nr:hypothetical protein [Dyella sp.]